MSLQTAPMTYAQHHLRRQVEIKLNGSPQLRKVPGRRLVTLAWREIVPSLSLMTALGKQTVITRAANQSRVSKAGLTEALNISLEGSSKR